MEKCNVFAGSGVLLASTLFAGPAMAAVVNDGTTVSNVALISNTAQVAAIGAGNPGGTLQTNGDGTLRLEFANSTAGPSNAVKGAFVTNDVPGATTLTAATTLRLSSTSNNARAGVVIVDTTTNTGVGVYYRGASGYRIVELNFNQASSSTNEIVLSGGTTFAYPSGVSPTAYSTVGLSLSPNAGNAALADLSVAFNGGAANTTLTGLDLSAYLPFANVANFRAGYWGYWAGTEANPVSDGGGGFLPNYVETARFDELSLTPIAGPVVSPPTIYFTGATSNSLNNLGNFSTDLPGAVAATVLPGTGSDVYFASTNASVTNLANVTAGLSVTINSLTFGTGAATANPVTIGGNGSITINAGNVGYAAGTGIVKQAGAADVTINNAVVLGGNQSWTNSSATALTVNGNVALGANDLTLAGTNAGGTTINGVISGNGSVNVNARGLVRLTGSNTYTGTTTVNGVGSVLRLTPSARNVIFNGPSGANIENGAIAFEYSGSSPAETIRGRLAASFQNATTPGVMDSGSLRSGTASAVRGLGWKDDGTAVIVKDTLFGDADLDGGVSINDFNVLAGNFGMATDMVWADGDFDYDGGVSINDFNMLAGGFGQSLPQSSEAWAGLLAFAAAHNDLVAFEAVTGVPEPASLTLLAAGLSVGLRRRRSA